jgi:hypothetical protein
MCFSTNININPFKIIFMFNAIIFCMPLMFSFKMLVV